MFVIEVIPLKRGLGIESLTYYSSTSYETGTLITVPLRLQATTAVVIGVKLVSVAKTALKTATFSLRKLEPQTNTSSLPALLLATVQKLTEIIPASSGAILFALLPPEIRNGERLCPKTISEKGDEDTTVRILTDTTENRYITYRSSIRETFAHRGSVLFVVPTGADVATAKKHLELGIENRVITFASTHTKKQLHTAYEAFEDHSQAKLIITTPSYAFLDRHDITSIIIESAGSTHYTKRIRPYLDVREVLKIYAKQTGRSLLLADAVVRTEDEIKRRDDLYTTLGEHTLRLQLQGTLTLAHHKKIVDGGAFSLCTDELAETIARTLEGKGHVFLYGSRRGLAPVVTCANCGFIFRCPDSGAPYSLFRTYKNDIEERWFFSSTSGKRVRAADTCPTCSSWRLREQGIGIQQVYDEIKKRFPNEELFLFDHSTATTHAKAQKIVNGFYSSKKGILIGTSMALPYLHTQVDTTAVMSYEATRTLPTWKAEETIFALLVKLRELTKKDVVVQLRTEPDDLLLLASKGLISQFYEDEIEVRKALLYPPYSVFILLSWSGTKEQTQQVEQMLTSILKETTAPLQCYSAPESSSTQTLRYGLLRIEATNWPDKTLMDTLRTLPPYIKIEVNPDRIV